MKKAIAEALENDLLYSYCFPTKIKADYLEYLIENTPKSLEKCFLLSTGSEAVECAIKLMRTWGKRKNERKIKIISFHDDFHGRTMGSQMVGGSSKGKDWIVNIDSDIHQVPFPNAYLYDWADERRSDYSDENCFNQFLNALKEIGVDVKTIAGIIPESYQGGWVQLMPKGFVQRLRKFCDENEILLAFDEVQSGFSRTGKLFCYEHYEIEADLVCCGKGMSSSLPISAVLGRKEFLDLYGPNEMTSTHSGNPVCVATAFASIKYIISTNLSKKTQILGEKALKKLKQLEQKYFCVGVVNGVGLVFGIIIVDPQTKKYSAEIANKIVDNSIKNGVLFFAPVGVGGSTIKIAPPLTITEEALFEGLEVFEKAIEMAIKN